MNTMVDYTSSTLDAYRSLVHDAIMIYGFILENSSTNALKARFKIEDGLGQWGLWSDFSKPANDLVQSRTRTCAFDPENFSESLSEQKTCHIDGCSIWISIDATDVSRNSEAEFQFYASILIDQAYQPYLGVNLKPYLSQANINITEYWTIPILFGNEMTCIYRIIGTIKSTGLSQKETFTVPIHLKCGFTSERQV